jgi:flagellar biogenesis protein FliO
MRRTLIAILVLWSSVATAAPFEILDRGDAIEIIAHNVKAARTAITPARQRLEVELAGTPSAPALSPSGGIVKTVEFDGSERRRLSIKFNFERPEVKTLARYAQAIQVGNDLHVLVPSTVPEEGASVVLPDPTVPPELAQKLVGPPPIVKAAPPPAPKPEIPAPPAAEFGPAAAPAPAPAIAPAPSEDGWAKLATYGALGLGALGCGIWMLRRKRAQQGVVSSIDVIAQRSLGAKAKVVWLSAGGRDMVVAITPQNVRMLSQWEKQEPLPRAQTVPPVDQAPSEAVAGILRLRAKTNVPYPRARTHAPPEINEDVATGDDEADAAWAREILAATGGRR